MIMLGRRVLNKALFLIFGVFVIPFVSARSMGMDMNFVDIFEVVFGRQGLGGILTSDYGVYGLTMIFYYLLLFSVFAAGLKRIKMFEGEGGLGLNFSGKLLSHAFTGLSLLGIFSYVDPRKDNVFALLSIFGMYGQLVLLIVMLLLVKSWLKDTGWNNLRKWGLALFLAGLLVYMMGAYSA